MLRASLDYATHHILYYYGDIMLDIIDSGYLNAPTPTVYSHSDICTNTDFSWLDVTTLILLMYVPFMYVFTFMYHTTI
jgi:hypothetical protein